MKLENYIDIDGDNNWKKIHEGTDNGKGDWLCRDIEYKPYMQATEGSDS